MMRARAKPAAWIYQIARNKRLDYLRSPAAQIHQQLDDTLPVLTADSSQRILEQNLHEHARHHLTFLPPEQSQLVAAAFLAPEQQTHLQLAKTHRLPLGTVKSRLRLALSRLRQLLAA